MPALTIAGIDEVRWRVELFFKTLKQILKSKTFVCASANALKLQTWTALIDLPLVRYL
jgi:IS4 transposase